MTLQAIKQGINKYFISPFTHTRLENISIISSNCIGGVLSHDYGLKFLSPTVNLFIMPGDYIKLVNHLSHYLKYDVEEVKNHSYSYPIGRVDDVLLYFVHYTSFENARIKWNERKERINFDRIFLTFTDQNGCTDEMVEQFANFPYKKVFFTSQKKYQQYPFSIFLDSEKYAEKHSGRALVDDACLYKGITGKRNYEYAANLLDYLK